ncbi:MAG: glycolate oxidase subunit GlcF [Methyloligellaceae bacterium]
MQTNFTKKQLSAPRLAEAESILQKCVQCGLCNATCSSYVLLKDERDGPRGRIFMIKDMLEGGKRNNSGVREHLDRCMSCLSCVTTCPADVDYMHLVDLAKVYVEETGQRSTREKFFRALLSKILPYPNRFRAALTAAIVIRPFRKVFDWLKLKEISAMLELVPSNPFRKAQFSGPGMAKPHRYRTKRVSLMRGCTQQVLRPEINDATVRLLARQGVEVIIPQESGCCGSLDYNMGKESEALAAARHNVDAWYELMRDEPLDAIIINAGGCGTTVKDYRQMLSHDPAYSRRAEEISDIAQDISEFLVNFDQDAPHGWSSIKVAYHSACTMQHGQKVNDQPRYLLQQAGYTVLEVPEGHICCGSGGTFNMLQPDLASDLRERKVRNIESIRPDVIATGNIGCISQIAAGTDIPIVHTVELLDWALGGPCPRGMEKLRDKVTEVSSIYKEAAE